MRKRKKEKDSWRISRPTPFLFPHLNRDVDRDADGEGESRALFEFEIREAREFICLCRLFLRGAVEVSFI